MIDILHFYDFEVFKHDWILVIIDPTHRSKRIIVNDRQQLEEYYNLHKEDIWVGFNSRFYDQHVLRAILCGFDPKEMSDYIIVKGNNGWQYSHLFRKFPLYNYDVMNSYHGLKTLEAFQGHNITETSVSFNLDRKLTQKEIEETVEYCVNDVEETINVFLATKANFDASMGLIKLFDLPLSYISKTHAQIVAAILGGKGKTFHDEFELEIVSTLRLNKYAYVLDWYKQVFSKPHEYKEMLTTTIAGMKTTLAYGGIHGSLSKYQGEGHYLLIDVTAYYPSLQLIYGFGYRNMGNPKNFERIHNENLRLKTSGDKKARLPYKIADNSISGQLKDKHSKLYDPKYNNAICINGQLLLLDLIEKLEPHCQLIFANTDGILLKLRTLDDFDTIDDLVYEWEKRTKLKMDFEWYRKVFVGDVNTYVIVNKDDKYKSKGAYVKQLHPLDYDLPIVNKAMINYMVKGVPVEQTIRECNELKEFQKIVKISGKYLCGWHGPKRLTDKTFRVFASKQEEGYIGKQKEEGATIEKFANTPAHCFIDNTNVNGKTCPEKLDKEWYIDLTKTRLKEKFNIIS